MKVNCYDVEDLAALVLGLEDGTEIETVEQVMWDKLEISMESFQKIVEVLMPFTIPSKSPLTGTIYHGFVSRGAYVVKAEQA